GYFHLIREDGTVLRVKAFPLNNPDSTPHLYIILFKKTEVQKQEWCSDLLKQTMLYTAILQSMREGVVTIDPDFRITSFSRRSEHITGFSSNDVMGKFCFDILGSPLCHNSCVAKKSMETKRETDAIPTDISLRTGKMCHITEMAVPLQNEVDEIMGTLLFIEDRSAQVLLEGNPNDFLGIIGRSAPMRHIFQIIKQVSPTDVTVLITGESGTGKEMIARAIHTLSRRKNGPFQAINCAALPLPLLESELFGHVKGAFTGATRDRPGNIETAEGGTLFLDEIGEIPLETQSKLLRFLQEYEYQRVGDSNIRVADVRIIAATNRDLKQEIIDGNFREDLYYRIRVIPVEIPSLRDRSEDILLLAVSLLESLAKKRGRPGLKISPDAIEQFMAYRWPGNVRELINTLEYAIAMAPSQTIQLSDLPRELRETAAGYPAHSFNPQLLLDQRGESEIELIRRVLSETAGNKAKAARLLNMHRVTLYRKMQRYGIESD
ncbi:sigma 54-interacting transcriptional regulator, partial [Myxococcota bacterium]|nr:sigma 54-interacting transcriptional regulator [Myxococcota bacterium]